ncbi:hypothetical protein L202_05520 [Cryptococcus amylolentus CBS 6039]|uniref:Dipeptidyl-peptidase V n=1 Tax=Cryptococcus amylolentus CBS 6039 TaxID=1295533 RepID=A0A1E3HKU3_9TREE|nr:hypothetical protein L202_05520 [Cryptococcus amylolentus CBS 6039]ODN76954.1 hypothetical protein L202_05520 [Cryptococcus amylolentus CBS 6039]
MQHALLALAAASSVLAFTAEDMLAAPRPAPAIASPDARHALSVVDQWHPDTDHISRSVYLLPLNTTVTTPPISLFNTTPAEATGFLWLSPTTLAYLNDTSLYAYSIDVEAREPGAGHNEKHAQRPTKLLTFPAGVNPTSLQYEPNTNTLAFTGQVWADGSFTDTAFHDQTYEGRRDSAQVYDELFVRHWDTWRVPGKVWTLGTVSLKGLVGKKDVKSKHEFVNVLNGTGLFSQTDPIDASSYALTSKQIAVALKPPYLSPATHTRQDIYLFSLTSSRPRNITPHVHGAISSLTFSPDQSKLAWLEMNKDGYESDRRVVVVYTLKSGKTERWTEAWDRSPSDISWSTDSDSLYLLSEHHGRTLPYHLSHPNHLPTPLLFNGSTTSLTPLSESTLLLARQSLVSPSDDFLFTLPTDAPSEGDGDKIPPPSDPLRRLTSWSAAHLAGRLDNYTGEEFWFTGAEGKDVMGWAIKPHGWKPDQNTSYPLAFLIHGGPQGAWEDSWSTRWNPAIFAAQGYFVVTINPTGSTGYGQEFTDAIQGDWGGKPFKDLLAGYQHALSRYPEIDPERTTALGASYGGYMINWINGHNDHFGFKALVCHDGVFDTVTTYFSTEEIYFPTQDFAGTPFNNKAGYEKWSPVNHVIEWTTPELVIQGGKDYRLENSQGLGAFTALQVQGVPSRFVYFPDENHWVLKPHNSIKWHHEVLRWLHEWVGQANDQEEIERAQEATLVLQE